jgi:anti-anti-sigma factor
VTDSNLRLEGELTIYTAQDTRQLLLQVLAADDAPDVLRMDLRAVTETDTAGIQLLLAAREHARSRGREVRFAGMAQSVEAAIQLLGLEDTFADARDDAPPDAACADVYGDACDEAVAPTA